MKQKLTASFKRIGNHNSKEITTLKSETAGKIKPEVYQYLQDEEITFRFVGYDAKGTLTRLEVNLDKDFATIILNDLTKVLLS